VVILLGSYDERTKRLLYRLREDIVREYAGSGHQVYAFLLEGLEVYDLEGGATLFLEEFEGGFTAYFFGPGGMLEDVRELRGTIEAALREAESVYGRKVKWRVGALDKLRRLIDYPHSLVLVLREVELTRGGEYIELAYLVSRIPSEVVPKRVWFFKREEIPISTMVKELLTDTGIQFRTYRTEDELVEEVLRVIRHYLKSC